MAKITVIQSWRAKSPAEFAALAEDVAEKLLGVFPNSKPEKDALALASELFKPFSLLQPQDISSNVRKHLIASRAKLNTALQRVAIYVEMHCDNDALKVIEVGLTIKTKAAPLGQPPMPENARATTANQKRGTVRLNCNPINGVSYEARYWNGNGEGAAQQIGFTSRLEMYVTGLTPGNEYHFQLRANGRGKNGSSDWTNPVNIIAQ